MTEVLDKVGSIEGDNGFVGAGDWKGKGDGGEGARAEEAEEEAKELVVVSVAEGGEEGAVIKGGPVVDGDGDDVAG